jgi:hypothetical protein
MSMGHWWNYTQGVKPKYWKKYLFPYLLSTMNSIWSDLGLNLWVHCRRPATKHLNHVTWTKTTLQKLHLFQYLSEKTFLGRGTHSAICDTRSHSITENNPVIGGEIKSAFQKPRLPFEMPEDGQSRT